MAMYEILIRESKSPRRARVGVDNMGGFTYKLRVNGIGGYQLTVSASRLFTAKHKITKTDYETLCEKVVQYTSDEEIYKRIKDKWEANGKAAYARVTTKSISSDWEVRNI